MRGETHTCDDGRIIEDQGNRIRVFVPMQLRRQSGRREIITPETVPDDSNPSPILVALARAYVWQTWIDEGEFENAQALADHFCVDASLVRRILRLGVISPRIVEAVLEGNEPEISLQTLINMDMPAGWDEQYRSFIGR